MPEGPPHDIDAEQAVLGAMLIEPGAARRGLAMLRPDDFYPEVTRRIFTAMVAIDEDNAPVDIVTVAAELRKRGWLEDITGEYLSVLPTKTPTAAHILQYAAIVKKRALGRKLMAMGDKVATEAQAGRAVEELIADAQRYVTDISQELVDDRGAAHIETVADDFYHWHAAEIEKPREVIGARLGIKSIDEALGGLAGLDGFVCFKGFSGFGKSKLLRQAAIETAKHTKKPVLVYMLEGHPHKWLQDCVGYLSGLSEEKLERGGAKLFKGDDEQRLIEAWSELPTLPLYLTAQTFSIRDIYADAIGLYRKLGPKNRPAAIIVDYLQVMQGESGENLVETIVAACNMLRNLNAETGVPILTASQITAREGRRAPAWGAIIENTASLLLDISRGDIKDSKLRNDPDLARQENECALVPVKQRHGGRRLTVTELGVDWGAGRFRDLEDGEDCRREEKPGWYL